MIQTLEPDYYIHIGVKDDKIVRVDWTELMGKFVPMCSEDHMQIIIIVRRLLKEARKMVKPNIKTKSQADIIEELLIKAKEK